MSNPVAVSECFAMVGGDDDHCIVIDPELLQFTDQLADLGIEKRDGAVILRNKILSRHVPAVALSGRPVPGTVARIHMLVTEQSLPGNIASKGAGGT